MQVESFQIRFREAFGTEIQVYTAKSDGTINTGKGAKHASPKSTLASICAAGHKVHGLTIMKSKTVGEIELEFAEKMGIGIQILLPDGSRFAPNETRLKDVAKEALELFGIKLSVANPDGKKGTPKKLKLDKSANDEHPTEAIPSTSNMHDVIKNLVISKLGGKTVTVKELEEALAGTGKNWYNDFLWLFGETRISRGLYAIPTSIDNIPAIKK